MRRHSALSDISCMHMRAMFEFHFIIIRKSADIQNQEGQGNDICPNPGVHEADANTVIQQILSTYQCVNSTRQFLAENRGLVLTSLCSFGAHQSLSVDFHHTVRRLPQFSFLDNFCSIRKRFFSHSLCFKRIFSAPALLRRR